jgi:uncharacterized protein with PQ loop repeat
VDRRWVVRSARLAIAALAVWVLFGILVETEPITATGPEKISGIALRIGISAAISTVVAYLASRSE